MHLASNLANSVETDNNSSTDQNLADDDENQVIYIDQPINYSLIRVPISLTLFILTTYVMLGGALFMAIEGSDCNVCLLFRSSRRPYLFI